MLIGVLDGKKIRRGRNLVMGKPELLIKPVSYECNLDCGYCFYKKTSRLYPRGTHKMGEDVLEKIISEAMTWSGDEPRIFCWQGGEPLLAGVEFFKRVVELQKKHGKTGQVVGNSIQTNTTLLNSEWIELFRQYNFSIGVSLDGPEEVHNCYRQYASTRGSFSRTVTGINLLRKGGIDFNILSTIAKETAENPQKIYDFFLSEDLHYLQFIPAVDRNEEKVQNFSITPIQYRDFLCRLFDVWWNDGSPVASVRLFDNILEILLGHCSSSCLFKRECGDYIVVEYNGDVYPCDFFVRVEWKLGNILELPLTELSKRAKLQFGKLRRIVPPDCESCQWNFICNNGCLWLRWVRNGSLEDKDYFCESYKYFFSYTIGRLEKLCDSILRKDD